jgi:hypothetical protein
LIAHGPRRHRRAGVTGAASRGFFTTDPPDSTRSPAPSSQADRDNNGLGGSAFGKWVGNNWEYIAAPRRPRRRRRSRRHGIATLAGKTLVNVHATPNLREVASEVRESGLHPAARNQRVIAVGEDSSGGLHAGSSNGFDTAAADRIDDHTEFLEHAVEQARMFAADGLRPDADLLPQIETATPADPSDLPAFTVAQDCWICLATAVRSCLEAYDPAESSWYLVEPIFQSTSESLFGYTDVGSAHQQEAESDTLADPRLQLAIEGLNDGIDHASRGVPSADSLRRIADAIRPIEPR